nr:hypothetical protein [Desulfobacula sp.]
MSWIFLCRILNFLKEQVSPHTHVHLMSQYRPMGEAKGFRELSLPLPAEEFRSALKLGRASGLVLVR